MNDLQKRNGNVEKKQKTTYSQRKKLSIKSCIEVINQQNDID